jgi:hypothetical protein
VQYVLNADGTRTPYNAVIHGFPVMAVMAAPGAVQMNPLAQPMAAAPVAAPKAV